MAFTPPATDHGGRVAGAAGIGSAVALVLAVTSLNVPHKVSDARLVDWWSKSGNRASAVVSMYLMAIAGLLFLGFLGRLRAVVAGSGPAREPAPVLIGGAGVTYVACLAFSGALRGVIGRAVMQRGEPLPGVDLLRYLPQLAYAVVGVFAMGAALVVVVATTVATLGSGTFPRWHSALAAAVALGMAVTNLVGLGEFAIPLLAVWLMATSILLGRVRTSATAERFVASHQVATAGRS